MFGTLVVVLPVPHEGGELGLRHDGKEWTFNAMELLAGSTDAIAYIAFFSDVEHEVFPVRSGYRVTLTYNLFYGVQDEDSAGPPTGLTVRAPAFADKTAVGDALATLLEDASFLPNGGTLGFGLRHKYPFPAAWAPRSPEPLESLKGWLKGGDDALFRACGASGLSPYLRLVYEGDGYDVDDLKIVVDCMPTLEGVEYGLERALLHEERGTVIISTFFCEESQIVSNDSGKKKANIMSRKYSGERMLEVSWVTEIDSWNTMTAQYIAMGNEPSLSNFYLSVCLLVEVGPPGARVPVHTEDSVDRGLVEERADSEEDSDSEDNSEDE